MTLTGSDENSRTPPAGFSATKTFAVGLACLLTAIAVYYCPIPFSLTFVLISVALVVFAVRHAAATVILMNLAAVFLALGLFEGYLGIKQIRGDGTRIEGNAYDKYQSDDTLGYAPEHDALLQAKKYYGDELVYDVVYSIDAQGLRIAPPVAEAVPEGCLVFFGDSITFGEGVKDSETYPYLVGLKTHGRYVVRNLAFSGYGPHQMLANLQSDHFSQLVNCWPTHFFYFAIPAHVARVSGLTTWDKHGPRFILDQRGEAVRAGNFDDPARFEPEWVQAAFEKFLIWQRFFGRSRDPNQADLKLFTAVVRRSAQLAKQLYPHSDFHVFLEVCSYEQDPDCGTLNAIQKGLQSTGMLVHLLSEAIPDIRAHQERYRLSAYDRHPNQLQHRLLADFIVDDVLTRPVP